MYGKFGTCLAPHRLSAVYNEKSYLTLSPWKEVVDLELVWKFAKSFRLLSVLPRLFSFLVYTYMFVPLHE